MSVACYFCQIFVELMILLQLYTDVCCWFQIGVIPGVIFVLFVILLVVIEVIAL